MKGAMLFLTLAAIMLSATVGWGAENSPAGETYALEEVSVSDCDESVKIQLGSGQATVDCSQEPRDGVIYPKLKSRKPIYGTVPFNMSLFDPEAGFTYHFVLDESAGVGYDLLYFDANGDSDLTNDSVVGLDKDPHGDARIMPAEGWFQNIEVSLDYGPDQGVFKQTITPRVFNTGDRTIMFFSAPTVRKGKIKLGSEEIELVLGQAHSISGRYDGPMTGAFLAGKNAMLPLMGYWRMVDGTFYRLVATPAGDKVTVSSYTGPFGILDVGSADSDKDAPTIDFGYLHSREALLDIHRCPQEAGKIKLPVGDYRPFRLAVRRGKRRIALAADTSQLGKKDAPAVFPYKIREGKPFVLDFSDKPEVVFKTPVAGDRITAGQTLKVEATLCDTTSGLMVSAIEDTTKPSGSTTLPNNREMELFESVAPKIKIANSSGEIVAEGTMPFG